MFKQHSLPLSFDSLDMSIASVNIAGFMKFKFDEFLHSYIRRFDIFGMCETWARNEHEFENFMTDYTHFDFVRKRSRFARRNSGGVTVLVKIFFVESGLIKRIYRHFEECVVLQFKGSLFDIGKDIIMVFAYVSPEHSPIYSFNSNNGIDILSDKILELTSMYTDAAIFVAGDLNSRIKDLCDFIPNDCVNYIFSGNIEFPSDSFDMSRTSKDTVCNNFGLSLIDLCCTFNIHIFNGRLFNDKNGEYTCFANNGASVVDYM